MQPIPKERNAPTLGFLFQQIGSALRLIDNELLTANGSDPNGTSTGSP